MATRADDDPTQVVDSFLAGDQQAFADIYSRWSALVYTLALRTLDDVSGAEDVTQRVFTRAWTSRRTFTASGLQLPAWLIAIAQDVMSDARPVSSRRVGSHRELPVAGDPTDPAELADRLVLADEMSRLASPPQQVMRMALTDGLRHDQIAERMDLPPGLVKSHIRRTLVAFQQRLAVLRRAC